MKQLLISVILILITFSAFGNQDSTQTEWKEKYFKYSISSSKSIIAAPLFAIPTDKRPGMILTKVEYLNKDYSTRNWTGFTTQFIEQVLKKHLTIEEIRLLMDKENKTIKAKILFHFNYSGNILYAYFIFNEDVSHVFTDEKLYAIYQDFIKMKVDTEGFLWWNKDERKPTTEEQKKVFGFAFSPFFFKHNCP